MTNRHQAIFDLSLVCINFLISNAKSPIKSLHALVTSSTMGFLKRSAGLNVLLYARYRLLTSKNYIMDFTKLKGALMIANAIPRGADTEGRILAIDWEWADIIKYFIKLS